MFFKCEGQQLSSLPLPPPFSSEWTLIPQWYGTPFPGRGMEISLKATAIVQAGTTGP